MEPMNPTFDTGVFPSTEPAMIPPNCNTASPAHVPDLDSSDDMDAIYEIMERRYSSGETDTAARHNEHQP